ncbi:nuclear transport factor 2 family protein [Marinimicrobium sp. ARAG 43.8]|uniref:nuclear transport factor 2 family protein n=1 Tax=Marinimicrobium sp. ARAG 43.8 TaxID=3418719 RepID=UPI003CF31710
MPTNLRYLAIAACLLSPFSLAADRCLEASPLKALDHRYEEALRVGEVDFLESVLAEDYVWVHNHAVASEDKRTLLARLGEGHETPLTRRSESVSYRRLANTAVLDGVTTVEKSPRKAGEAVRVNRYHFMRTYVLVDGHCQLLSNQTMKVWSNTEPH